MDFMKMLEEWRRVMARSVLVFHHVCAVMGLLLLLSVAAFPYFGDTTPDAAILTTAILTGLLCLVGSCALGGGVRYAVYGDFKLLPNLRFRDYFSGDDGEEGERKAYVAPPLPVRNQRSSDDDLVDRVGADPPRLGPVRHDIAGLVQFGLRWFGVFVTPRPDGEAPRVVVGGKVEVHQ